MANTLKLNDVTLFAALNAEVKIDGEWLPIEECAAAGIELVDAERSFYRYWNKYYNESPVAFLNRLKLEYAKNNLIYTDMTISEIASKLGYSTIYFDRFFKRWTGQTPCSYRREISRQLFAPTPGKPGS